MAWYLNKETKIKWEVTDEELLKRLSNDDNYELIGDKKENQSNDTKSVSTKARSKTTTKK